MHVESGDTWKDIGGGGGGWRGRRTEPSLSITKHQNTHTHTLIQRVTEPLALEMFGDERRDVPSSLRTHGHVCSQGHGTDQGDGWDLVLIVFQDLTIEMNGEQFWLGTHSNQMPADVVVGTHGYIWGGRGRVSGWGLRKAITVVFWEKIPIPQEEEYKIWGMGEGVDAPTVFLYNHTG